MKALLDITKALADENRVRVIGGLRGGELCVCQIVELLDLAPSTVSKHLSILRQAGLVEVRKDGRWAYCRLPDRRAPSVVRQALALVRSGLEGDPRSAADAARLEKILKVEREILSCQQREKLAGGGTRRGRLRSSSRARH